MTRPEEQGSALIWAILFSIVVSGMIVSHAVYMGAHRQEMDTRHHRTSLSGTFARSGMTDALSWFQSQTEQPVRAFEPQLSAQAIPPVVDTLEPKVGLVREFEIHGNLWGRYEVRRNEVLDVSLVRGVDAPGAVWEVGARGVVYRRIDPDKPFDEKPNRVVTRSVMRTEVRGVQLRVPAASAINIQSPSQLFVEANASVDGQGQPAIAYAADRASDPANPVNGMVSGVPSSVSVAGFDTSPNRVFAMRKSQLRSYSNVVVETGALPPTVRAGDIVYVVGGLTLRSGSAFAGKNVLLVVSGDLVAEPGSGADVRGMVYVLGNATIRGPFKLSGSLVVGGTLRIGGSGQPVEIRYDAKAMSDLARSMARYRMSRANQPGVGVVVPVGDVAADISPTADVRPEVVYGDFFVCGPGTRIYGRVSIGDNTRVGANCLIMQSLLGTPSIGHNVRIGDDAKITGNAKVLDNAVVPPGKWLHSGDVFGPTGDEGK